MIYFKLISFKRAIFFVICLCFLNSGYAHPMPNSLVNLTVKHDLIQGEIFVPLSELQSAIGMSVNDSSINLIQRLNWKLTQYFKEHILFKTLDNKEWIVTISDMKVLEASSPFSGKYKELSFSISAFPPLYADIRNFYLLYDAVVHQLITHKIYVNVKQDWENGQLLNDEYTQLGIIELDIPSGKVMPFQVSLRSGNNWNGFFRMLALGKLHIKQGTDHLLFVLALLLPSMMLGKNRRWQKFGGIKYSLIKLFKIVTSFTFGHSFTLFLGSLKIVFFASQPIEILIAFSIFISALNAIFPLFSGKEIYLAFGFGLIHGLAFANTLENLDLNMLQMGISILGFNLGIEIMQIWIVFLIFPWLILLSQTTFYSYFRIFGALVTMIFSIGWILERISNESNLITRMIEKLVNFSLYYLYVLIIVSTFLYLKQNITFNQLFKIKNE